MNENKKLDETWVVEPLTTGTIETMELGVETSYKRVMALRLGDYFEGGVAAPTGVSLEALKPLMEGFDARVRAPKERRRGVRLLRCAAPALMLIPRPPPPSPARCFCPNLPPARPPQICENVVERSLAAARTFRRRVEAQILDIGEVADDFNFSTDKKRVLNEIFEPSFDDNVKQDASIDVYGRTEEEEDMEDEVARLANM